MAVINVRQGFISTSSQDEVNVLSQTIGSKTLASLADTTIGVPVNGEALVYNGSAWTNSTVSTVGAIDDLTDVTITTPSNGEALVYNGTAWVNSTVSTVGAIDDLTDVTITTPSTDQVLKYNGSVWINAEAPPSGLTAQEVEELSAVTTINLMEITADGGSAINPSYATVTSGDANTTTFNGTLDGGNS